MTSRQYPILHSLGHPTLPITLLSIRFSEEIHFNFLRSECVTTSLNQVVIINNRANLRFASLGLAIRYGIAKSRNEIIVICHEDIFLPNNWQTHLERSLFDLNASDPNWGILGIVGWTYDEKLAGHYSDPHNYINTLNNRLYFPVTSLDEQLLIIKKSGLVYPDPCLPSIHNIGFDLLAAAANLGKRSYVVNAPSIHKYADYAGRTILSSHDSRKIEHRASRTFKAEKAVSDLYLSLKWHHSSDWRYSPHQSEYKHYSVAPVIFVAKGGSGSRLLSTLGSDLNLCLGDRLNRSGDSLFMVEPIYQTVIGKYSNCYPAIRKYLINSIQKTFQAMALDNNTFTRFGFKLPEAILVLPELLRAFPNARFIYMVRDPINICLRRTHLTARLDNELGRTTVREAYLYSQLDPMLALKDNDYIRMAYTTLHQLDCADRFFTSLDTARFMGINFESLVKNPSATKKSVAEFLGLDVTKSDLERVIDGDRGAARNRPIAQDTKESVKSILSNVRLRHSYI